MGKKKPLIFEIDKDYLVVKVPLERLMLEIEPAITKALEKVLNIKHSYSRDLSSRQKQILDHLVEGKSNKEISSELNICVRTVKFHVSSLLREFNCTDRAELLNRF